MINPHWQVFEKYYDWRDSDIRRDLKSFEFSRSEQNDIIIMVHKYQKNREIFY